MAGGPDDELYVKSMKNQSCFEFSAKHDEIHTLKHTFNHRTYKLMKTGTTTK